VPSPPPLAQVYRATLVPALGGGEVAVKVQRPDVLAAVALDLHIMRELAVYLGTFPEVRWLLLRGSGAMCWSCCAGCWQRGSGVVTAPCGRAAALSARRRRGGAWL
jgi:hypothetical protein